MNTSRKKGGKGNEGVERKRVLPVPTLLRGEGGEGKEYNRKGGRGKGGERASEKKKKKKALSKIVNSAREREREKNRGRRRGRVLTIS